MSQHSFSLQSVVYSALSSDSALSAIINGVYDDVPEGTGFPYVVIGEDTATNIGTNTVDALEHTLTLHVWSQYRGRKEAKQIMSRIYEILHNADLSATDAVLVNLRQEFETTLVEADGLTRHGVMRFRAVMFDLT